MASYRVHGIVIRHQPYREADRLVTLCTVERGVCTVQARGARKVSSKLAGSLEPLVDGFFSLARGRTYDTVIAADVVSSFPGLRSSWDRMNRSGYAAYLVGAATRHGEHDRRTYDLLQGYLGWLDTASAAAAVTISPLLTFVWQYLAVLGFQPELQRCVRCQLPLQQVGNRFSVRRGGILCHRCPDHDALPVSASGIKVLRLLQTYGWSAAVRIRLTSPVQRELLATTGSYLNYSLERQLWPPRTFRTAV
ncbi:MAG: DNA repair protein RecO [Patescibacteria group bacterium]